MSHDALLRLEGLLETFGEVAVAVSGGVDSLTLATVAHRCLGQRAAMLHAVSPAVPAEATRRTRELARTQGWRLEVVDAGEFEDPAYRANPVNRCFYCKTNLYGTIARLTRATILSGTNLDDLGEYRPGLEAAKEHGVRHPYVEVGIDKAGVRGLARRLSLPEVAELPSAPCLSSRVETGIAIEAPVLAVVHEVEKRVAAVLSPKTVRCRVRKAGVVIELDAMSLSGLDDGRRGHLDREVGRLLAEAGLLLPVSFAAYRTGSAFLTGAA
jgi:pyridinium-3,5-biscarboxylic acid mononucleotide sulfurtransferase